MKKLFATAMAAMTVFSCAVFPASAAELESVETEDVPFVEEVQPREILTLSKTQRFSVGNNTVAITVYYTVRPDYGNESGQYITGILNSTGQIVSGWGSIKGVRIDPSSIVYRRNHQIAILDILYDASNGAGFDTYTATMTISLL